MGWLLPASLLVDLICFSVEQVQDRVLAHRQFVPEPPLVAGLTAEQNREIQSAAVPPSAS